MPKKKVSKLKPKRKTAKARQAKQTASAPTQVHPWRLCPPGRHWVREHSMHVPPSERHPEGGVTTRRGHCADNPTHRDQLYPDEILEITDLHFPGLKNKPCPLPLKYGKNGSAFDDLIAGWAQYWNEVLKPDVPLDPNLLKALIASESGFKSDALADKKNQNSARGLGQIINQTRVILGDEKGELKDHFVTATRNDLNNPSINICAGTRWLFHKKFLAEKRLGRPVSWEEAVAEYKSILRDLHKGQKRAKQLMDRFLELLEKYQKCGNS